MVKETVTMGAIRVTVEVELPTGSIAEVESVAQQAARIWRLVQRLPEAFGTYQGIDWGKSEAVVAAEPRDHPPAPAIWPSVKNPRLGRIGGPVDVVEVERMKATIAEHKKREVEPEPAEPKASEVAFIDYSKKPLFEKPAEAVAEPIPSTAQPAQDMQPTKPAPVAADDDSEYVGMLRPETRAGLEALRKKNTAGMAVVDDDRSDRARHDLGVPAADAFDFSLVPGRTKKWYAKYSPVAAVKAVEMAAAGETDTAIRLETGLDYSAVAWMRDAWKSAIAALSAMSRADRERVLPQILRIQLERPGAPQP